MRREILYSRSNCAKECVCRAAVHGGIRNIPSALCDEIRFYGGFAAKKDGCYEEVFLWCSAVRTKDDAATGGLKERNTAVCLKKGADGGKKAVRGKREGGKADVQADTPRISAFFWCAFIALSPVAGLAYLIVRAMYEKKQQPAEYGPCASSAAGRGAVFRYGIGIGRNVFVGCDNLENEACSAAALAGGRVLQRHFVILRKPLEPFLFSQVYFLAVFCRWAAVAGINGRRLYFIPFSRRFFSVLYLR